MVKIFQFKSLALYAFVFSTLSACTQRFDLQGHDPQEYYAAHPIENKVETRHAILRIKFDDKAKKISESDADAIRNGLKNINLHAIDNISIHTSVGMAYKNPRVGSIKEILRKAGYLSTVTVATQDKIDNDKAVLDITFADVVSPDCPDWKRSPITTYGNMTPANYSCAATVNLGLMVDNPRDLVRGQDSRINYTERGSKILSDYHDGVESSSSGIATASTPAQ